MKEILMLKIFLRTLMTLALLVLFMLILFQYKLIVIVVVFVLWFALMIYLDPPKDWDK
jgi:hypothetical protein